MSRGGRELFHTNFLAFILEQTSTKSNENEYGQLVKKRKLGDENYGTDHQIIWDRP